MAKFSCEVQRFGQNFLDGEKTKSCFTASCLEVSHTCVHLLARLVFFNDSARMRSPFYGELSSKEVVIYGT
jgi:hypothetical protein